HGKRNRPSSTTRYRNALDHVIEFVGAETSLMHLAVKDLNDFQLFRIAAASKRTIDFEMDVTRSFLNWCRRRSWVRENCADGEHVQRLMTKKAKKESEKRIFTDDELKILLAPAEGSYWQLGYIFQTLYFTGLRIGELGHLQAKDIDLKNRQILIREKTIKVPVLDHNRTCVTRSVDWLPKNGEARAVPIEPRLEPILRDFLSRRVENVWGLLFLSERGVMVTDHLSRVIKGLVEKQDVGCHTFRHTHISHALNRWGRHPSVVQKWAGHADLKTTMAYLHVSDDDLQRESLKMGGANT
ncbi:MAG TPA: site-specific integrase, partial [Acidobacteriota bacterium]